MNGCFWPAKVFSTSTDDIYSRKAKLSGGGLVNTDSEKGKGELFIHFKCLMVQAEIINASISTIITTTSLVLTQALNIFDILTHLLLSTII